MGAPEMTIDEWLTEEYQNLEQFADMWRAQRQRCPIEYPPSLPPGEWDEQFRSWCES